ncbi:MAG: hypothetical protein OXF48_10755, partial [Bacteroidetes bacterium]|nr:hypothetical protein [Bacteroidota bacterium]
RETVFRSYSRTVLPGFRCISAHSSINQTRAVLCKTTSKRSLPHLRSLLGAVAWELVGFLWGALHLENPFN